MPQISANVHISESRGVLEEYGATCQGIHGVYVSGLDFSTNLVHLYRHTADLG